MKYVLQVGAVAGVIIVGALGWIVGEWLILKWRARR